MRSEPALLPALKVSKLIPLLASDHDAEIVATARAIGRTLSGAGLSFHELAAVLAAPPNGGQLAHPSWSGMSRIQRLDVLNRLLGSAGLTAWERAFCDRIRAALHLWPRSEQSVKQRAVLDELIGEVLP
jgi:hypothetical protein